MVADLLVYWSYTTHLCVSFSTPPFIPLWIFGGCSSHFITTQKKCFKANFSTFYLGICSRQGGQGDDGVIAVEPYVGYRYQMPSKHGAVVYSCARMIFLLPLWNLARNAGLRRRSFQGKFFPPTDWLCRWFDGWCALKTFFLFLYFPPCARAFLTLY